MRFGVRMLGLASIVLWSACSSPSPSPSKVARGRVVVALTIDWEGAYLSPEGLDKLEALRKQFGSAPVTHFISAGYFTKSEPDPDTLRWLTESVLPGDEVAVHLHGWRSLAVASQVTPKLSPSFLTGTDKLLEFEDGDVGFDLDLDAYSVPELRAMLRTSRRLLEQTKLPISTSFRAGGYLGTSNVLQALQEEGFTVDSSATDHRQLDERKDAVLPERIRAIWPSVTTETQPFTIQTPRGGVLEIPVSAFADYATASEMLAIIQQADRRAVASGRDQFVVLGFHQETATTFGERLEEVFAKLRAQPALSLTYMTIEQAANAVRAQRTTTP